RCPSHGFFGCGVWTGVQAGNKGLARGPDALPFRQLHEALQLPNTPAPARQENRIMITLYTFGPMFGLPDPSPFVTKGEVLLKMAKIAYRTDTGGFSKAPKGKLPYIDDDGTVVADSTFIRWHLEKKYRVDFDQGLDPTQRATAWAFE